MRAIRCALAVLVALAFGCGEKGQEPETSTQPKKPTTKTEGAKPAESKVEMKEGKFVITEKGGAEKFVVAPKGDATLPEGFPKDVPVYEGAKIVASYKMSDGFMVMVQTTDQREKAVEACKSALKAQGWKLESTFDTPQMLMLSYKKGKRGLNLGVSKEKGPTRIQYQVSSE